MNLFKWLIQMNDFRMFISLSLGGGSSSSSASYAASGMQGVREDTAAATVRQEETARATETEQTQTQQTQEQQDIARNIASQSDTQALLEQLTTQLQQQQQTTTGSTEGTTAQTGVTAQTQQTLDQGTQDVLAQLVQQLSGTASQGAEASELLTSRALTGDEDLAASISDIVGGARARGETEIARGGVAAAQQAGSSMNSIVQQLGIEGAVNLETQLAELEASLGLQARAQVTGELQAGGAEGTAAAVTSLSDVLKGATTTATTEQETQTSELVSTLQELVGTTEATTETTEEQVTTELQQTQEQQTMTQLTDVLSQLQGTEMSTETSKALETLMQTMSGMESFVESGSSSSRGKEAGIGFAL